MAALSFTSVPLTALPFAPGECDAPLPSGVTTDGEVLYEDPAALDNEGLDDKAIINVVSQESSGTKDGAQSGVSYAQARQEIARTAALRAAHEREMAELEEEEEADAGFAAPLFD